MLIQSIREVPPREAAPRHCRDVFPRRAPGRRSSVVGRRDVRYGRVLTQSVMLAFLGSRDAAALSCMRRA